MQTTPATTTPSMPRAGCSSSTPSPAARTTDRLPDVLEQIARLESSATVPAGADERFAGYGVMGLPFASGHYLALRRFPANSLGPAYTTVWWRNPAAEWVMFSDTSPTQACPRYFGQSLARTERVPIDLTWSSPADLQVAIDGMLEWRVRLGTSPASRLLSLIGANAPDKMWRNRLALTATGYIAAPLLRTGKIRLHGNVPNGQWFQANPRRLWLVESSQATIEGENLGPIGPLAQQARLADVWLPQRGIFFIGEAYLEPLDPRRHWTISASRLEPV